MHCFLCLQFVFKDVKFIEPQEQILAIANVGQVCIIWAASWKTNKMSVRSAKTQISLGICPVWSESLLSAWRKLGSLATHWVHSEDSDQMIRLGGCPGWYESSLGTHSFCWFCHEVAHMYCQVPEISKTTDYLSIDRWSVVHSSTSLSNDRFVSVSVGAQCPYGVFK